ncbi:hypothetical protein GCM10009839_71980 [Catenulispora yoronensis]|uniref:Uncharacterized protein n=1 Tax=Catenulispora yoronensis TaxID=450799 RepID=A0ABN2V6V9_9ACTN
MRCEPGETARRNSGGREEVLKGAKERGKAREGGARVRIRARAFGVCGAVRRASAAQRLSASAAQNASRSFSRTSQQMAVRRNVAKS